jgi:hypothetical protein
VVLSYCLHFVSIAIFPQPFPSETIIISRCPLRKLTYFILHDWPDHKYHGQDEQKSTRQTVEKELTEEVL